MQIAFRPSTPNDVDFARIVHHEAYREVIIRQFGTFNVDKQNNFFESDAKDIAAGKFLIILADQIACGYTCLERQDSHYKLRELVISPCYQGQKIGQTVLEKHIAAANSQHLPIQLSVLLENKARNLYSRNGFAVISKNDTHFLMDRPFAG